MSGTTVFRVIDRWLTSVTLRSEALAGRLWRIGRWSRAVSTHTHEMFLELGHRLGWTDITRELLAAAQATAPKQPPRHPSRPLTAAGISQRAVRLTEGRALLAGEWTVPLDTVSWRPDPFHSGWAAQRFAFHCLDWVRELLEAHEASEHPAYLETARVLAERWMDDCLHAERDARVWDDHVTALRALVLCRLWAACWEEELEGSGFMRRLFTAIARHGHRLADSAFYRADHNHGVTQAYALLAIGLEFPSLPSASAWVPLAIGRLEAQMVRNVSSEGIHREHSPFYHFYVFRQFLDAHHLARAYDIKFSPAFAARLGGMLDAGAYLIKPDGTLPALGDTSTASAIYVDPRDVSEWPEAPTAAYLCSMTQGVDGHPPAERSLLFRDAGYAVLRSGWGEVEPFSDERYLVVRLATAPTSHIHRDVLSFELYGYGGDLVVDSGGPFGYGHPLRDAYFLTTAAHNTVLVHGSDQEIGPSTILEWQVGDTADVLVAEHATVPGVLHRRALVLGHLGYVLVLDRLVSSKPQRYSQLFHLAPSLRPRLEGTAVRTAHPGSGPTLQLVPLLAEQLGVRLHRGTVDPPQGWVCGGDGVLVPNVVVAYERSGPTATFATLLVPERAGMPAAVTTSLEGRLLEEATRIEVTVDGRRDAILVGEAGEITVTEASR